LPIVAVEGVESYRCLNLQEERHKETGGEQPILTTIFFKFEYPNMSNNYTF